MSQSIYLEILGSATISAPQEIEMLNMKTLVPKMVVRRRLTRAAKMVIYLSDKVAFDKGRIVYGSSFGELPATANILHSIQNEESISPTHFQNSVYNTAVSYLSILNQNKEEILTISSGDKTAYNVLKAGAIKALDGDEVLLILTETIHIENIEEVNACGMDLESAVALKVKQTMQKPTMEYRDFVHEKRISKSLYPMFEIAQHVQKDIPNIIEITL